MKQLMLATVASLALSLPAMAQSTMQPNNTPAQQSQHRTQMSNQGQSARNEQQNQNQRQAQNVIRPSQLSHRQIRQIQQALNKKGFDAKHVDGIWGRETADALHNFQKQNGLQGRGELTHQSLAKLGVNVDSNAQQGSATTGAGSDETGINQPSQNPGMTKPSESSRSKDQGTNGQGQTSGSQQMNQAPGQTSGSMNSGQSSGSNNASDQSSGSTNTK